METSWQPEPGSFKDPRGFVFWHEGTLYRQINRPSETEYRRFVDSGLYDELSSAGLLVPHDEVPLRLARVPAACTVIRPARIPFVSYPYEWCFSQLKAAALLTLDIQKRALQRGLTLRDASAYNVQFVGSRPIFIDTLSFGTREDGSPWPAYRQFCQHFLGPLALTACGHASLNQLTRIHIDGVPLEVVRDLLPARTWMRPGLLMHVHLHARSSTRAASRPGSAPNRRAAMPLAAALGLAESLERAVQHLTWKPPASAWSGYTDDCNYTAAAQDAKRRLVAECVDLVRDRIDVRMIWDLGANTGEYSRIAAEHGGHVVSFDMDHAVVDQHYRACRGRNDATVLPLIQDLTNPSSGMGWHHSERRSLVERGPADLALALALIHHLALGANVPLRRIAALLRDLARFAVVEFVPKEDSQVRRMMQVREDVFPDYTPEGFAAQFREAFHVVRSMPIPGTVRTLHLLERR